MSWMGSIFFAPLRCVAWPFLSSDIYKRLISGEPLSLVDYEEEQEDRKDKLAEQFNEKVEELKNQRAEVKQDYEARMHVAASIKRNMDANKYKPEELGKRKEQMMTNLRHAARKKRRLDMLERSINALETHLDRVEDIEVSKAATDAVKILRDYVDTTRKTAPSVAEIEEIDESMHAMSVELEKMSAVATTPASLGPSAASTTLDDAELMAELDAFTAEHDHLPPTSSAPVISLQQDRRGPPPPRGVPAFSGAQGWHASSRSRRNLEGAY